MTQLSFMPAIDAALPFGTACGTWWWHRWQPGDRVPPGWRPPAPGADFPKPRREAGSPPGIACEDDVIEMEIARAVDAWLPDGMENPILGIHETRRLACGGAWACVEVWDRGLAYVSVRDGVLTWGHVPGAGEIIPREGTTGWDRLPARESWDAEAQEWAPWAHWSLWMTGDPIPPGMVPPVAGISAVPFSYGIHDGEKDDQIASEVWDAALTSFIQSDPEIPWPFWAICETKRLPDGALWACLQALMDGGLSCVTLRDGVLTWSEAPGAGALIYAPDTRTWVRMAAMETWDAEAEAWVPKASSTEAVFAPPDVEAPETLTSASPDVEALETSASDLPDVAPEPAAPVAALQPSGGIPAFLHAHNLATDEGWKALAESLGRTTPGDVRNAVSRHVAVGSLSDANARLLLARIEAAHPEAPAEAVAPEPELPDVDPVHEPPSTDEFLERLAAIRAETAAARAAAFKPSQALLDVGLARLPEKGELGVRLLPPAAGKVYLRYRSRYAEGPDFDLVLFDDVHADDVDVRRIEEVTSMTAKPAVKIRRLSQRADDVSPPQDGRADAG